MPGKIKMETRMRKMRKETMKKTMLLKWKRISRGELKILKTKRKRDKNPRGLD